MSLPMYARPASAPVIDAVRGAAALAAAALVALAAGCTDLGDPVRVIPGPDSPASCDSVVISAERDAVLYEDALGGLANGAGESLFAGRTGPLAGELLRRSLLWFDVRGAVPAGAQVVSVTLTLEVSRTANAADRTVSLHRVTAGWSEGTTDPPEPEGPGDLAGLGDVTWIHREFDTLAWATPGGDFDPAPLAQTPVGGEGPVSWNGAGLDAEVGRLLDPAEPHFGWLLRGEESLPQTAKRFHSRESTAGPAPMLAIRYCFPTP